MTPIKKAIEGFGTQRAFASAIGASPVDVCLWASGKRKVPAVRCLKIESVTGGVVTRYELRPDVFGPAPDSHGQDAA